MRPRMIVHQSMLSSWARCPAAYGYDVAGAARQQSSALAYGSVLHYAVLEVFERLRHRDGVTLAEATQSAIESFRHYWHPMNIDNICAPVDYWLPRQTYSDLLIRGEQDIAWYAEAIATRAETVLATEFSFQVPILGTWDEELGEPHVLAGTVDRLSVRTERKVACVEVSDLKTGKDYWGLRQNLQFSAYAMASTQKEFWFGWRGEDGFGDLAEELWAKTKDMPRRGWWISTKSRNIQDAGWRGPQDYRRFAIAVEQIVASQRAEIYPLNISGETCTYCEYKATCTGEGVPDADHGAPALLVGVSRPGAQRRPAKRS